MRKRTPAKSSPAQWFRRVDRAAGQLNAALLTFAIGLAALDVTCFVAEQVADHLPPATQGAYAHAPTAASIGSADSAL